MLAKHVMLIFFQLPEKCAEQRVEDSSRHLSVVEGRRQRAAKRNRKEGSAASSQEEEQTHSSPPSSPLSTPSKRTRSNYFDSDSDFDELRGEDSRSSGGMGGVAATEDHTAGKIETSASLSGKRIASLVASPSQPPHTKHKIGGSGGKNGRSMVSSPPLATDTTGELGASSKKVREPLTSPAQLPPPPLPEQAVLPHEEPRPQPPSDKSPQIPASESTSECKPSLGLQSTPHRPKPGSTQPKSPESSAQPQSPQGSAQPKSGISSTGAKSAPGTRLKKTLQKKLSKDTVATRTRAQTKPANVSFCML